MASFSSSVLLLQSFLILVVSISTTHGFVFNGFKKDAKNLTLDEYAVITPAGALQLTNVTSNIVGRAFFSTPIKFFNTTSTTISNSTNSSSSTNTSTPTNSSQPHSFATHFVFSITPVATSLTSGGHGMTFVLSPTNTLPKDSAGPALGFTTRTNGGNASSNSSSILAVEFDTVFNANGDLMGDHVGINMNSYKSVKSAAVSYYDGANKKNMSLVGADAVQAWVEYNGAAKEITVTISPMKVAKPKKPLLSYKVDLSTIIKESMYVGFTASTGSAVSTHSVLGWSFGLGGGPAPKLDVGRLPPPPRPQCVIRR